MSAALAASRAEPIATAVPRSSLPGSWRTRSRSVQGNCGGRERRFRPPISASIQARLADHFRNAQQRNWCASARGRVQRLADRATRARRLPLCLVGIRVGHSRQFRVRHDHCETWRGARRSACRSPGVRPTVRGPETSGRQRVIGDLMKAKAGIRQSMLSLIVFVIVLGGLVSVDARVRDRFSNLISGGDELSPWGHRADRPRLRAGQRGTPSERR